MKAATTGTGSRNTQTYTLDKTHSYLVVCVGRLLGDPSSYGGHSGGCAVSSCDGTYKQLYNNQVNAGNTENMYYISSGVYFVTKATTFKVSSQYCKDFGMILCWNLIQLD